MEKHLREEEGTLVLRMTFISITTLMLLMICALVQSILYRRNNNRSQVSLPLSVSPPLPPPAGQRETNQVSGRKNEVNEVRILAVSYKYQRRSWRFCLFFLLSSFCFFLLFAPLN